MLSKGGFLIHVEWNLRKIKIILTKIFFKSMEGTNESLRQDFLELGEMVEFWKWRNVAVEKVLSSSAPFCEGKTFVQKAESTNEQKR